MLVHVLSLCTCALACVCVCVCARAREVACPRVSISVRLLSINRHSNVQFYVVLASRLALIRNINRFAPSLDVLIVQLLGCWIEVIDKDGLGSNNRIIRRVTPYI